MEIDYVGMQEKAAKYNCELTCIESSYRMTKKIGPDISTTCMKLMDFLEG